MLELTKKLKEMTGKDYLFDSRRYKILQARFHDGKIQIATDKGFLDVTADQLKNFLPAAPEKTLQLTVLPQNGMAESPLKALRDTVLDTIEKVKASADYIPQATTINDGIKTVIDLAKIELQALNLLNKMEQ